MSLVTLIPLLVAILALTGQVWRTGRRIGNAIGSHITVTAENTKAIDSLSARVTALEKTTKEGAYGA